ncbi:hypothetical protein NPIL_657931, partial [Nephila pilipes]
MFLVCNSVKYMGSYLIKMIKRIQQ